MQKFTYDMFDRIEQPTFILSNVYHHHIGEINNIDYNDINVNINMSSADEMSFNVYKERNGEKCRVWDSLVSFKYVYVPEHNEYYKIDVVTEEDNATVKKLTLTSAAEYELSNRIIRNLEVNTESDILQDDYVVTVFYNKADPRGSLLDRILSIKCPGWRVGHVDDTLCNIQRTFSISNQSTYQALTDTIAKEIECLFTFDSVKREISAYDLDNICEVCGYRGNFTDECPKCPKGTPKKIHYGYGKDTNIFISYNNFSEKMTVDGDEGQVKNCFYVTGGDDNINAAIINCNPTGTAYMYKFSQADYADMPPALVAKLQEYSEYYDEHIDEYQEVVADWYDAINNFYYYKTSMMPRINGKPWEANKSYSAPDSIVYVKTLPSWCYLQCCKSGTSGAEEFDATSVYEGQIIDDGTAQWIVRKNILTLPSARQIVEGGGVAWKANKTYAKDETVFTSTLPYNLSLKCKTPGKSGGVEPDTSKVKLNDEVTDGTVTWVVVENSADGLRQYFADSNNMVWFLNELPGSMREINNEIKNVGSLQFNNIFRMEVIEDDGKNDKSKDPIEREVTKINTRWQNNKFYVDDIQQYNQYVLYKKTPEYIYHFIDKTGQYTGKDFHFYNETPSNRLTWQLKQIDGDDLASGFVTVEGEIMHFSNDENHYMTASASPTFGGEVDFYDNNERYIGGTLGSASRPNDFGRFIQLRNVTKNQNVETKKWKKTTTTVNVPTYTWTGNIKVYNTGDKEDTYTTTVPLTAHLYTTSDYEDYEKWMKVKIDKRLAKGDSTIKGILDTEIPRDPETGDYVPEAEYNEGGFVEQLTQYSLDMLSNASKTLDGCLEVLNEQGTGDKDKDFYGYDLYDPVYYPYFNRKKLVGDEMKIREATVKEWEDKKNTYFASMRKWQEDFDLTKFIGDDLYEVFFHYIREGDYNNPNYISDGISDGEVINYAKKVLELANEELNKATELQYTLSDSLENLLNTTEFRDFKDKFQIGDYLICEADDEIYKLRLIGVSYNYGNPESINVTFSNVTKVKNYFSDAQDILSKAQSMTTSYNTTVHQVEKSSAVTDEVESWKEDGMSSSVNKIVNDDTEEIVYDENGLLARAYDDISETYSPKQLRIQNNKIVFTQDNWETTSLAIGENDYQYWDSDADEGRGAMVTGQGYGVNAKFIDGGYIRGSQIISGDIYSENWNGGEAGSWIDLNTGEFNFGGGGLVGTWNGVEYELTYKGKAEVTADVGIGSDIGSWTVVADGLQDGTALITPSIVRTTDSVRSDNVYANSDIYINNQSLTTTLSGKQNILTAGDNITIENDVISAVGGTTVIANPSGEPTTTLTSIQIGDIIYALSGGNPTVSTNANISTLTGQTSVGLQGRRIVE